MASDLDERRENSILFNSIQISFYSWITSFHSPIPKETETRDIDKKTLVSPHEKEVRHGGPYFLILILQNLNFLNFLL